MTHSSMHDGKQILSKFLYGFILLYMSTGLESAALSNSTFGNESDRLALLDFKKRITEDPQHIMSSWNDSTHFCGWRGVTCNNSNKRVLTLKLNSQNLVGSLTPSIGNLTYLTGINLTSNGFHGEIPQEIGRLRSLEYLNLSYNSFGGKIPTNMSSCTQLKVLSIYSNKLTGSIPDQLSSLLNLNHLWVDENNLTGTIPYWVGNFSYLKTVYLGSNNLQGIIPKEFRRLTSLERFSLQGNNLSGLVPSSIYNISSIYLFDVTENQLQGEIPPNVGNTLPNLIGFFAGANKFTGRVPVSFGNASRLERLDVFRNSLTGALHGENLGSLRSLVWLNFEENRLGSGKPGDLTFLTFLANCTRLETLGLYGNRFGGELPGSIANLSTQLISLTLGGNMIHGVIPEGIGYLVNLTVLVLEHNNFGGTVPNTIGKLQKLVELYLNSNKLSGPIPSSLGNLSALTNLYLDWNMFEGSIPPSLANCQFLLILYLSHNNLSGSIPKQLLALSSLSMSLNMSHNSLTGSLPSEVGDLVNLAELDVSENKLSGEIPQTLGSCIMLVRLHLEGNKFEGIIPQSLKNLRSLEEIDVSGNNLSGQLPEFLGKFTLLEKLNLSHNNFEGELPKEGIFFNASGVSVLGNDRLCGGIPQLHLPACSHKKPHSTRGLLALKVVIPIASSLALIIALSCFIAACSMVKRSRRKPVTLRSYEDWKSGLSYSELFESTNGFSIDNLIGSGSFGSVYKGVLSSDVAIVAVKVLNLQQPGASKSFIDECKTLKSIRHRNLLKIITACSSIDNQGNDFKSLVFEFMENGSLDPWIHPKGDEQSQTKRKLSLTERLDIAIDVASALDYLHYQCETPIVHCDLKPSNVLLDEDMVAHVGDFGLARFLLEASNSNNLAASQTMSAGLKGSIGYIPPEYGMAGQVSILGDTYSYGILLLEMFTGKSPTDDVFIDGQSIHRFTAMALPDHVMDVVDRSLLLEIYDPDADDEEYNNEIQEGPITKYQDRSSAQAKRLEECLVSVMEIGLACSSISPAERMPMNVVVNKLKSIRESYLNRRRTRY
ncbi:probable LRR receptor-like serine/threonine-protein kinase At3g47570 [Malus domestica]|uniref:probable LRR receptor-like serine/threonine-protein kinase At3g47570 n=1 Tax=Malus domestica TaxID=3750 RepID=UPI0010AAB9B0|nr:probable LRR receptor-like serine/threonine-protein kinase At3g47570 [Malus domestica]